MDNITQFPTINQRPGDRIFTPEQATAALDMVRNYLSLSESDLPGEQRKVLAFLIDEAQVTRES